MNSYNNDKKGDILGGLLPYKVEWGKYNHLKTKSNE